MNSEDILKLKFHGLEMPGFFAQFFYLTEGFKALYFLFKKRRNIVSE